MSKKILGRGKVGNLDEVEGLLTVAQRIKANISGTATAEYAGGLSMLSAIYAEQNNYDKAKELLTESLNIHRSIGNDRGCVIALQNLTELARRTNRHEEA